jgi:pseudouridine kinase
MSIDDMEVLELINPSYIHRNRGWFKEASMVIMDANLAPSSITSTLQAAARYKVPTAMNAVSVGLAPRIRSFLPQLSIVAANKQEAAALVERPLETHKDVQNAAKALVTAGAETAVITLAENGLCYATPSESGYIEAISCDVVDNTGAGAALMAAVVYGLVNNVPVDEAMRLGVSAATLTLKCTETVCTSLNLDMLYDQLVV